MNVMMTSEKSSGDTVPHRATISRQVRHGDPVDVHVFRSEADALEFDGSTNHAGTSHAGGT